MATRRLQRRIENRRDDDTLLLEKFPSEQFVYLGGDGLVSVGMKYSREHNQEVHELMSYDHVTEKLNHLGYFSVNGYYTEIDFGCCPHEPGVFCQLSPDGNFLVLLGPMEFARSNSRYKGMPVVAIYQVTSAKLLHKATGKNVSFLKCDPISISLSPPSNHQYCVAIVTEKMEIRLWETVDLPKYTSFQLRGVSPCFFIEYNTYKNPFDNCLRFSPDGNLLGVTCYMKSEGKCACLILNVSNVEPLSWMAVDEVDFNLLRGIFPVYSDCGTKVVLSTVSRYDGENRYDLSFYEMLFSNIPIRLQSLKDMCRAVVLKRVPCHLLNQLPLSDVLISFLAVDGIGNVAPVSGLGSLPDVKENKISKCSLM